MVVLKNRCYFEPRFSINYVYITSFKDYHPMEELKRNDDVREREIVFSRTIKAGKRIYYVDVKRNRKDELYLAITESKKIVSGEDFSTPNISFEKHKIFLYREDFEKFLGGMNEAISYIEKEQGKAEPRPEPNQNDIKIDMEF